MWAEVAARVVGCGVVLGAVWIANSYSWPERLAQQYALEHNIPIPQAD